MDLEVVIEGVSDMRLASEIKQKIRQVCRDTARSGQWSVVMSPSETRGEWDLGVRGPSDRHFVSFPEGVELSALVAAQLRACLERAVGSGGRLSIPNRSPAKPAEGRASAR